ncbi:MAG TPA: choice-of-anchor Q domain-containing protein, partial [Gemmataceae bacterium]|nr:choice-of-anchor Q domain-containing protein [Gemmataceae bacterium]
SPAIDAGDPALAGTTDQRGVARLQGAGVDIGAYERIVVPDAVATAADVNAPGGMAYIFTVTYSDTAPINLASLGSGNVTVAGSLYNGGTVNPAVTFVGVDASNPNAVVASYQFTPPGGAWSIADDGAYTVTLLPNQVSDANGFAAGGWIGSFRAVAPLHLVVANANDSGPGSLRDAILQSNVIVGANPNTIDFSNSTAGGAVNFYDGTQHTISLLSPLPLMPDSLTMTGPGSAWLTVQRDPAAGNFRVFDFNGTSAQADALVGLTISGGIADPGTAIRSIAGALNLSNVTIANNGNASSGGAIYMVGGGALTLTNCSVIYNAGGGISNSPGGTIRIVDSVISHNSGVAVVTGGALTIANSTVSYNTSTLGGLIYVQGFGTSLTMTNSIVSNNTTSSEGAIHGGYFDRLTITDSILTGNTGGANGGALYISGPGTATISNTTIANNTAAGSNGSGGGILMQNFSGTMNITGCTITANLADAAGPPYLGSGGGGIAVHYGSVGAVHLDDSIVAGNSAVNGFNDFSIASTATVTTAYSAIGSTAGFNYAAGPGDLPVGTDLKLQTLANNGGPTQTVAFAAGSPLLNAGDPALTGTSDQRGVPRSIGGLPDIGAYEYQPITVADVQVNDGSAQRSELRSIVVTFSGPVSFTGGNAAAAFQLTHVQTGNTVILTATVTTDAQGRTVVALGFSGGETDPVSALNGRAASLADGRYQLIVLGAAASDAALGWALDGNADGTPGGDYVSPADSFHGNGLELYRLFGDVNGDGVVDATDLGRLRTAFNTGLGNPNYVAYLDADNSGAIDIQDLGQFRSRFNANVF